MYGLLSQGLVFHLDRTQMITWNLFVLAGLILFALMLAAAWRVHRESGRTGIVDEPPLRAPGPGEGPQTVR